MNTHDDTPTVRVNIEGQRRPSEAIVEAVAAVTRTDPTAGPQLYESVDPDALDEIFADYDGGEVKFEYGNCHVTVINDTAVTVDPSRPVSE